MQEYCCDGLGIDVLPCKYFNMMNVPHEMNDNTLFGFAAL